MRRDLVLGASLELGTWDLEFSAAPRLTLSFRLEQRKQDHVPDRFRTCQEHHEPVDAEPEPARGGHPMFESEQEFLIELLRLLARLFEQSLPLHDRIVPFGIAWGNFLSIDAQFV